MRDNRTQQTHALRQRIDEQRTAFGNGLALLSSIMLLFTTPAFAVDSLFEVVSPNAGQEFAIGSTMTVQWVMHNRALPGGGVMIQVSPDQGLTWFYINKTPLGNYDTMVYQDSIGTFTWTIVDSIKVYGMGYVHLASATCYVEVTAPYDDSYLPATSNRFSIVTPSQAVRPQVNGKRENHLLLKGVKGDRSFVVDVLSLNGRTRSTTIELVNSRRGYSASGLCFLRPRSSAGEQITPWCVEH
jgi:hypothetical protein